MSDWMDGWMDGWMDTLQTVMTTRAPAVLTTIQVQIQRTTWSGPTSSLRDATDSSSNTPKKLQKQVENNFVRANVEEEAGDSSV